MSGGLTAWLKLQSDISNSLLRLFEMSDHTMGDYMSKTATTATSHSALISFLPSSKSQDFDKCESPENKAGRLEQERQCDAKERDECAPRLKAKVSDESKNLVEDKTSKLTPDKIGWGNLENNEQACKTAMPDVRTRARQEGNTANQST
ncbi:hypothetical protein O181_098850 [Austropuccinia psidii MF-1]|uniref:Uncharacterized protein n=1 Tax=Austropuccinia psidii MF-1 TaxID=1389203 RepID=A0A9Q3JCG3_9BASI|nr:hypothetical protein [Austropuccinia psidii MF-1]